MKNQKLLLAIPVALIAVGLAFPVSNLFRSKAVAPDLLAKVQDPKLKEVASVYANCMDCHSSRTRQPFYASFPVAKGMIEQDVRKAVAVFDMETELFSGQPVNEASLVRTERAVGGGTMPPARYTALHWGAAPGSADVDASRSWTRSARAKLNGIEQTSALLDAAVLPLEAPKGPNPEKISMGNKLFHDKRLSSGDELSCASCHDLAKGGTDQAPVSTGVRGQKGPINSPTVFNAVFALAQFWDGRSKDLQDQANGPVNNPLEMGSNWDEAIGKLRQDEAFVAEFTKLYPDGLNSTNITDAIAEFEKSLVTTGSRFDKHLAGDAAALTDEEKKGYAAFRDNGCDTCHVGRAIGQRSFERFGLYREGCASNGAERPADLGRFNVTKADRDRNRFKVPTLRNVAITFPYFHNASTSDLTEAVKAMGRCQLNKPLADADAVLIASFLKTLTGTYDGKQL